MVSLPVTLISLKIVRFARRVRKRGAHTARTKVMLKKTLHKNGVQGGYREPMVVSEQALSKLRLFLPIVKKFQITFCGKFSIIFFK